VRQKETLVLIPGWGSSSTVWAAIEPALALHFHIHYVELMSPELCAEPHSLAMLLDSIAKQLPDNSVVLAWSLGGMLATKIAVQYKNKISKLIVAGTNISFVETDAWKPAMAQDVFAKFVESFTLEPEKTKKRFLSLQVQGEQDKKRLVRKLQDVSSLDGENQSYTYFLLQLLGDLSLLDDLHNLDVPSLFIFGEQDALVPCVAAAGVAELAENSGNENIQVETVTAAHAPHLSQPEACLKILFNFLNLTDKRYWKDKKKIAKSFSRAAPSYDRYAFLQRNIAEDLLNVAGDVEGVVADLGCGTGYCIELMQSKSASVEQLVGVDIAKSMLDTAQRKFELTSMSENFIFADFVAADIESLPIKSGSLNWAVSSLAVQWCENLYKIFNEVHKALHESGQFLLSVLGPDTLQELTQAWSEADPNHIHVNQFFSVNDVMDAAESNGFEMQVFKADRKVIEYENVFELMRDLKGIGAHNVNSGSNKGLTGKSTLQQLSKAYERFRNENQKLPATYDVQYWLLSKRRKL